jgi:phosphoribosylformylglycinamidine synthase
MEITAKTAKQLRLTEEEFELIKKKLGRTPNFNELCAFSGCGVSIVVIKIH